MAKKKGSKSNGKDNGLTPFENKLLSRLRSANERLQKVDSIEELRSDLTIRRVKLNLEPRTISGDEIKQVRKALRASQSVFAVFIQVPVRTLQEWEQGRASVPGCAARLIGEMLHNPQYWRDRFKDVVELAS